MCTAVSLSPLALALAFASQLAVAGPPHYRVIDYGTLGGPSSAYWVRGRIINDGGVMIYQGDIATPDPYGISDTGFVERGIAARGKSAESLVSPIGDPERDFIAPVWIADNGLIAGLVTNGEFDGTTGFPQFRGMLWHGGQGMPLGDFGGHGSAALSVNSAGVVVGTALNAVADDLGGVFYPLPTTTQARAFVWQGGAMKDIGTLGGPDAIALAVNSFSQVAGNSTLDATVHDATGGQPTIHPFLWQGGRMRDVGSLGGTLSVMGPINDFFAGQTLNSRGEIAGASTLSGDANWHAFRWSNGLMQDLGTLGGPNSDPYAINESGHIVGRADISMSSIAHHAFLWRNGRMIDLGTLTGCENTTATSVNDHDDVVGYVSLCGDDVLPRAWLSEKGGQVVDLNELVVGDPGMLIFEAFYIDNAGAIAAEGLLPSGDTRAVLLTPTDATDPVSHLVMHVKPDLHGAAWRRIHEDELSGALPTKHR